jgi:hypothetical protein
MLRPPPPYRDVFQIYICINIFRRLAQPASHFWRSAGISAATPSSLAAATIRQSDRRGHCRRH